MQHGHVGEEVTARGLGVCFATLVKFASAGWHCVPEKLGYVGVGFLVSSALEIGLEFLEIRVIN